MGEVVFATRGRMEIIRAMLSVARTPVGKTRLIYGSNVCFDVIQKYIPYLSRFGLLESSPNSNNGKDLFQTTEKGRDFVRAFEKLNRFFEEP